MRFRQRILGSVLLVFAAWAFAPSMHAQFAQQGSKLIGTGAAGNAMQGYSVALSADGNTALVGGLTTISGIGGAWVWVRGGGVWTQQGPKLVGTGAVGNGEYQEVSVVLSADGNTALVGSGADNGGAGAVWVWTRSGGVWAQQGPKLVSTGATGPAQQGSSVALSGDGITALVGGVGDNGGAGAVWIWTRSGAAWTQQGPKLVGTGAVGSADQGGSVALSADGNTALVGGGGDNNYAGAAWVWTRSGGVWTQQGPKLVGTGAVDPASQGNGVVLSADGNTALVGGPQDSGSAGAVWVWTRSSGVWTQQGPKLVGTGAVGIAYQGYSAALSADGNAALVGGPGDNSGIGAAWVWNRSGDVWSQQGTKLVGTGAVGNANQGLSVALSVDGSTAIVGGDEDSAGAGAAWVFAAGEPSVNTNPMSQTVPVGSDATFTAVASGTPTPTVQWQVSTDNGMSFNDIPGATLTTYTFTAVASENGNQYRAVFTNSVGSATSSAATLTVTFPVLSIRKTHSGSFTQGQTGTWTISVGNTGMASTVGTVSVADTLPGGYTFASFSGTHWNCTGTGVVSCTSGDIVIAGSSFPTLSLTVNVPATSPTSVQNTASASGGGALNPATSNTDTVAVTQVPYKLAFTTQPPAYWNAGQVLVPAVVVQIQDAAGNLVPGSTAQVSISSTPRGVDGTLTMNAVGGTATFGYLFFPIPANYTLTATSAGLLSAISTTVSLNHFRPAGDFDGNGVPDLVWQNDDTRQVTVWYMGGTGGAVFQGWNYLSLAWVPGWHVVAVADFNGDGVPDLVWQNDQTRQATVWYMGGADGAEFKGWNFLSAAGVPGWSIVAAADFNGDGVPDLVWQNDNTRQVTVWYMGGTGGAVFQSYNYLSVAGVPGWHIAAVADFNGDGVPDLVWQNDTTRQVLVWYMGGAAVFQGWNFLSAAGVPGWHVVAAVDQNGDGVPDLIWQNDTTRQVTVWYMGGAGGAVFQGWNYLSVAGVPGWSALN